MWLLFAFAFAAAVQSAIGDSGASVSVALAALVSALLAEFFLTHRRHGFAKVADGSAAASALVLALMLPNHVHPMFAVMGALFAVAVVKRSFGGLGSNWMNPALAGWDFVRFSWPSAFPSGEFADGYLSGSGSGADLAVREFLNGTVFRLFGAELPPGYIDIFWLGSPGIIADRAVLSLFLLVAAMFAFRTGRWWVSVLYVAVFALLARLFGALPAGGRIWEGDAVLAVLSGGTLLTAFVLVVEPSGGSKSVVANAALAVLAAALGASFRYFGGEFYGGFLAAALVCAITPLVCGLERRLLYAAAGGTGLSGGGAS